MENARLLEAEHEATLLALALARIDQVLHSSLDVDDIVARALDEGGRALSADAATVMLQKGESFMVTHGWNMPAASVGVVVPGWRELLGALALRAREPIAVDDTAADARVSRALMDEWGIKSVIAVPLPQRGGDDAVLQFNYTSAAHHFSQAETSFAARLGVSLAAAMENARLYDRQRHIAETLQQTLMHPLPEVPGLELGIASATAQEAELIGGDFSDVFVLGDGLVAILIGDVAGKGVQAAGLTETVRAQVRSFATIDPAPHVVLARANDLLLRAAADDPHVTAFLALLDLATGRLSTPARGIRRRCTLRLRPASCWTPTTARRWARSPPPTGAARRRWRAATAWCSTATASPKPGATAACSATSAWCRASPTHGAAPRSRWPTIWSGACGPSRAAWTTTCRSSSCGSPSRSASGGRGATRTCGASERAVAASACRSGAGAAHRPS